jgi:hypothetical protein
MEVVLLPCERGSLQILKRFTRVNLFVYLDRQLEITPNLKVADLYI